MPVSHSQAQKDEATATTEAYGGQLKLVYYPSRITDEFLIGFSELESIASAKTVEDAKRCISKASELMIYVMKSWDYFEDDAQTVMWPLEPDRLAQLEFPLKMKCLYAIMRHMRPEGVTPQIPT